MAWQVVKVLIKFGAQLDVLDHNDNTPLHFCSSNGHLECAHLLIEHGANVNLGNVRGDTPLHNAARWGYVHLVEILLLAGASVTQTNKKKRTPLQVARLPKKTDPDKTRIKKKHEELKGSENGSVVHFALPCIS